MRRETAEEQSRYLSEISTRFQAITALALNANYVGSDWFDQCPSLRFPTAVTNRNELFSSVLERFGHTYEFKAIKQSRDVATAPTEPVEQDSAEDKEDVIYTRTTPDHADLEEVTCGDQPMNKTINQNTIEWLTKLYKSSRGFELGTFDSGLIAMTMKTQSSKWEGLALGYISDVITMAHTFITNLLQLICLDARVREGLMSVMMDDLMAKYKAALDNVRFLLHVERMESPTTLNRGFHENLEQRYVISVYALLIH